MIEIYVENQKVDVNQGFSALMSYAIDDIKDFGSKNTSFSKTIILPGTKRNNSLFGNIFNVGASNDYNPSLANQGINFNPAVSARTIIFQDNIQVFKGVLRLMQIVIDNGDIDYEVSVFGELGGFISKIGNGKLEDLDFSTYEHAYTIANITNSWNNASAGSGYYYPLIDYGAYSTNKNDWDYKTFRPSLFVKEYLDKIFAKSGYTYESDLFQTSRFKSLIVPYNKKTLTKKGSTLVTASKSVIQSVTRGTDNPTPVVVTYDSTSLTNFTYASGRFTYTGTANETISSAINVAGIYRNAYGSFKVRKNGTTIVSNSIDYNSPIANTYYNYSFDLVMSNVPIVTGDYFEVIFFIFKKTSYYAAQLSVNTSTLKIDGSTPIDLNVNLNDVVSINETIPKNILQLDFFASIIKLFNLYVFESPDNDKLLKIAPFVDFYADAETIDWSQKLDRGSAIKIKPMSELNSRYYAFNYKDDSDYYNDLYKKRYNLSYGSFLYDSQFEFAKETTKIDVIFSGTPLVGYSGQEKIYSTIFTFGGGVEEQTDSNIRILQAKKITGVASWKIQNGSATLTSTTNYGYAGHFNDPDYPTNDIGFGVPNELFFMLGSGLVNVNQFNVYWSSYMAEITDKDSKILSGTFKLDYKDIYGLDFSKLIYIDGSLFRLNKITDFNATNEDTCSVELVKIINRIY